MVLILVTRPTEFLCTPCTSYERGYDAPRPAHLWRCTGAAPTPQKPTLPAATPAAGSPAPAGKIATGVRKAARDPAELAAAKHSVSSAAAAPACTAAKATQPAPPALASRHADAGSEFFSLRRCTRTVRGSTHEHALSDTEEEPRKRGRLAKGAQAHSTDKAGCEDVIEPGIAAVREEVVEGVEPVEVMMKRARGRPPKTVQAHNTGEDVAEMVAETLPTVQAIKEEQLEGVEPVVMVRKRGRPHKAAAASDETETTPATTCSPPAITEEPARSPAPKGKRGRPRKAEEEAMRNVAAPGQAMDLDSSAAENTISVRAPGKGATTGGHVDSTDTVEGGELAECTVEIKAGVHLSCFPETALDDGVWVGARMVRVVCGWGRGWLVWYVGRGREWLVWCVCVCVWLCLFFCFSSGCEQAITHGLPIEYIHKRPLVCQSRVLDNTKLVKRMCVKNRAKHGVAS